MKDTTYCLNPDCPFKDCERNAEQLRGQKGIASFANFGGVCRDYIGWLAEETEAESKTTCK